MANQENIQMEQLKQTCRLTGASWATWLVRTEDGWGFGAQYALNKTRKQALTDFLRMPETAAWLAGALSSGRTRSRGTGGFADLLGCQRTFVFANLETQGVILVGAEQLSKEAQGFFRVLVLSSYPETLLQFMTLEQVAPPILTEIAPESSYELPVVLDWVLELLSGIIKGTAAFIAIREGDVFRVEAIKNYTPSVRGTEILLQETGVLAEVVNGHQGVILGRVGELPDFILPGELLEPAGSALCLPVILGQRVIGLVVFVAVQAGAYSKTDLKRAELYLGHVAYRIENAIVFAEVSRYLQQFALLNELAAAAASGTDIDEVARRMVYTLRRVFHTEMAAVLLLTSDGKTLREYGGDPGSPPMMLPVATSLVGYVVETGEKLRIGDISQAPRFLDVGRLVRSALSVPMIYRGKVIGVITIQSTKSKAFTSQDERLLAVIASHLATLLENVRLYEETRERARNLDLIHKVVERVVGLTDEGDIAQLAAELLAEYFGYEFVVILIADAKGQNLINFGLGGTMASMIQRGERIPIDRGILGQTFRSGESFFSNDVSQEPNYYPIRGWYAGSEMCVPLREGDQIFGLINLERAQKHAFSENDRLLLISLAGILSSVMMGARRYQELRISINHMQAARETALDIAEDLDLDALFIRLLHRAKELTHARGVALGLVDENERVVRIVATENPWWPEFKEVAIPLNNGVVGTVAAIGEPLIIADYYQWSGRINVDENIPFTTVAGVPLKWKGEVMGVILVADDQPGRMFQEDEVRLLELLAPQVALSIRNARLYQELGERIDAQRLAEKRLIHSARLAALGEMAAGVAHELNNPLTTVAGFVELALEELPKDLPQREELALVLSEARRAQMVVSRLLDFARQSENTRISSDLNDLVKQVISLMRHQAQNGSVQISLDLCRKQPLLQVDPNQIKQVLLNLIQNSLQAMPQGGTLTIRTACQVRDDGPWKTISVVDTGVGIPPENLDRIFEPFFSTRQTGTGTGLGLPVSYGLVADHGGHIEVKSKVGKGSCFTIWLPAMNGEKHV